MLGLLSQGWRFMARLPIQRLSGFQVTGNIEEGSGFGYLVIGRNVQGLMPIGFLVIGSREEEVGSGCLGIGSIIKKSNVGS
jgi:hypothetical protein